MYTLQFMMWNNIRETFWEGNLAKLRIIVRLGAWILVLTTKLSKISSWATRMLNLWIKKPSRVEWEESRQILSHLRVYLKGFNSEKGIQ